MPIEPFIGFGPLGRDWLVMNGCDGNTVFCRGTEARRASNYPKSVGFCRARSLPILRDD